MKLKYKQVDKDAFSSIYVERRFQPHMDGNWHFHKEYELIYFLKGQGMRIVGDHISHFQKGELVLVGEWLPHLWRNDVNDQGETEIDFIVVKFKKDFGDIPFFSLPELSGIHNLLNKSSRGILFSKGIIPEAEKILLELEKSKGAEKLINFLSILNLLSNTTEATLLSNPDFARASEPLTENRLQKVIHYISTNYTRSLTLNEIAGVAFMTPPAFCRYFKNSTNKTFSHFLNEFRIGKACQLLINGEKSIKQICYESGYSSLTNFNRTFRHFKGTTPGAYRAEYRSFQQQRM